MVEIINKMVSYHKGIIFYVGYKQEARIFDFHIDSFFGREKNSGWKLVLFTMSNLHGLAGSSENRQEWKGKKTAFIEALIFILYCSSGVLLYLYICNVFLIFPVRKTRKNKCFITG